MPAQRLQSFWHGPPLSPYEWLGLRSFLDHGHELELFVYDRSLEVPAGVRLADAATVVPRDEAYVLAGYDAQGGHVAFSNEFRFELLARRGGWWVDLDVVCLSADLPEDETFFALEQTGGKPCEVTSAVLRFPPGHPLARRCAEESRALGRALRARPGGASRRDFGRLGAGLIERLAAELGCCEEARAPATCYPVHWTETASFFAPSRAAELRRRTAGSLMVHLWNEVLVAAGRDKLRPPPRGSYLDGLFARHRIGFPPRRLGRRLLDAWEAAGRAARRTRRRLTRR
jgi:hypothetical protein